MGIRIKELVISQIKYLDGIFHIKTAGRKLGLISAAVYTARSRVPRAK